MKKCFLLLTALLSFTAVAEIETIIFPSVINYGNNVQVTIWNHSDSSVSCSGSIYMNLESGKQESEYYFDYVSARFTSYRSFYPRSANDRIISVSHSIFCN